MSNIRKKTSPRRPLTPKTSRRRGAIKLPESPNFKRRLGILFVVVGLGVLAFPTVYKNLTNRSPNTPTTAKSPLPQPSGFSKTSSTEPIKIDSKLLGSQVPAQAPMRIVIPRLSIDLPIVEAPVMNGFWELSDTSASHGVGSANPGEIGNTVVFAHARTNLFGPLRDIKKDDLIYILTKDRWFRYRVTETKFVTPQETSIISPTSEETLTLYTCSGFLDSKRLIVTAKPLQP